MWNFVMISLMVAVIAFVADSLKQDSLCLMDNFHILGDLTFDLTFVKNAEDRCVVVVELALVLAIDAKKNIR